MTFHVLDGFAIITRFSLHGFAVISWLCHNSSFFFLRLRRGHDGFAIVTRLRRVFMASPFSLAARFYLGNFPAQPPLFLANMALTSFPETLAINA